jgi:hypothetical protein
MRHSCFRAAVILTGLTLGAGSADLPALAENSVDLVSHEANYRVGLFEARMGEITFVDGSIGISARRGCESWDVVQSSVIQAGSGGTRGFSLAGESEMHEALDGAWFEFDTVVTINETDRQRLSGRAERDADGRPVLDVRRPEPATLALPRETLFLVEGLRSSLDALFVRGKRIHPHVLFDGSDADAVRATDLIAGTPATLAADLEDPDGLTEGEIKRVVSTFFDLSQTDSEPQMTVVSDILANGVTTRMTIDLDFMVIEATLEEITALPAPEC